MKNLFCLLVIMISLSSIKAQELKQDSLFTSNEKIKLAEFGLTHISNYTFDNTQINTYYKDILDLEAKRINNNTAGYVLLGVGVLSTVLGAASQSGSNKNSSSGGDIIGSIIDDSIRSGVDELGKVFMNIGLVISVSSVPFFINASSKKKKQLQKIREVDKLRPLQKLFLQRSTTLEKNLTRSKLLFMRT